MASDRSEGKARSGFPEGRNEVISKAERSEWEAAKHIAEEAIREANRKINDGLREYGMEHEDPSLE